jgi:Post-segregation antitoxin CcdA
MHRPRIIYPYSHTYSYTVFIRQPSVIESAVEMPLEDLVVRYGKHGTSEKKHKLTLAIDKELVEWAKKEDINMSMTLEKLLRSLRGEKKKHSKHDFSRDDH